MLIITTAFCLKKWCVVQSPSSPRFLSQKAEDGECRWSSFLDYELDGGWRGISRGVASHYVPPHPAQFRTALAARELVPAVMTPQTYVWPSGKMPPRRPAVPFLFKAEGAVMLQTLQIQMSRMFF